MKLPAVLLLAAPVGIAGSQLDGMQSGCACKATPSNPKQAAADGKPTYPGNADAYGWGCKAHDSGSEAGALNGWNGTACDGDTADGTDNDWCEDLFCIVDPNACNVRYLKLSYTQDPDDWFSYEACYPSVAYSIYDTFKGNGWVGRCKNCPTHLPGTIGLHKSYCACSDGMADCMCVATPTSADPYSAQQEQATGKPAYPEVNYTAYGWGCQAHDDGYDACDGSNPEGDGESHDWCKDKFCIVDNNKCTKSVARALKLTYTKNSNDFFSYETCDAAFAGNGWVGRCNGSQTAYTGDETGSYYTCDPVYPDPTPAPTPAPAPSPSPEPNADLASQRGLAAVGATLLAAAIFQ